MDRLRPAREDVFVRLLDGQSVRARVAPLLGDECPTGVLEEVELQ